MPHIHTNPGEHDHTVSAYVVRTDCETPKIMLHRHRLLGKFLQFGGHVELHENPWQALTHEVLEESGYSLTELSLLQPKQRLTSVSEATLHPVPISYLTHKFEGIDHYHTDTAFAFTATAPPYNKVAEGESEETILFDATELGNLEHDQIPENVREIALYVLQNCLGGDYEQISPAQFG